MQIVNTKMFCLRNETLEAFDTQQEIDNSDIFFPSFCMFQLRNFSEVKPRTWKCLQA